MAKGLCPGFGQSCGKESVEKRGREKPVFLGLRGKPIKPFHWTSYHSGRHRAPSPGGVEKSRRESELGRLP